MIKPDTFSMAGRGTPLVTSLLGKLSALLARDRTGVATSGEEETNSPAKASERLTVKLNARNIDEDPCQQDLSTCSQVLPKTAISPIKPRGSTCSRNHENLRDHIGLVRLPLKRLWCHLYLRMFAPGFRLVPKLIGHNGSNMKRIAATTCTKIRIRGQGSGHREGPEMKEAPVPLMIALTTDGSNFSGFELALQKTLDLLHAVERELLEYCKNRHPYQGPAFKVGEMGDTAESIVRAVLRNRNAILPVRVTW